MSEIVDRHWEKVHGYISENEVDVRWILRQPNDGAAYGSLRIVSHPDLKPGFLRAFVSFVTSRRPKTPEEIAFTMDEYKMDEKELEIYSIDEHVVTSDNTIEDRFQDLEKLFGISIFK